MALRPLVPAVPDWAWLLGFVSCNALINLLGIGLTARINIGMLAFQLATLSIFVVVGLIALYHGQGAASLTLKPIYDPAVFSMGTIVGATSIAVLSFLGFDGISTLAEESRGGEGAVARATLVSLLLVGALFLLQTWIAADLARGIRFASPETAFYEIAGRAGGTRLRLLTIATNTLANFANAIVAQAAVSRILFAMARDGKLPAALARVHPRFRTPHVSTLLVAGVSLAVGLLFASHLDDLTRIVNFGALTGFLLLHVAVVNHYVIRGGSRAWLRHLCAPIAGFVVIAYVLYEMDSAAKIMGAVWIAAGIAYSAVLTRLLKKSVELDLGA